jgi:hypothetical protein
MRWLQGKIVLYSFNPVVGNLVVYKRDSFGSVYKIRNITATNTALITSPSHVVKNWKNVDVRDIGIVAVQFVINPKGIINEGDEVNLGDGVWHNVTTTKDGKAYSKNDYLCKTQYSYEETLVTARSTIPLLKSQWSSVFKNHILDKDVIVKFRLINIEWDEESLSIYGGKHNNVAELIVPEYSSLFSNYEAMELGFEVHCKINGAKIIGHAELSRLKKEYAELWEKTRINLMYK